MPEQADRYPDGFWKAMAANERRIRRALAWRRPDQLGAALETSLRVLRSASERSTLTEAEKGLLRAMDAYVDERVLFLREAEEGAIVPEERSI